LARQGKKFGFLANFEWNLAFLIKAHPIWFGFYAEARIEFSPYASTVAKAMVDKKATEDKKKRF